MAPELRSTPANRFPFSVTHRDETEGSFARREAVSEKSPLQMIVVQPQPLQIDQITQIRNFSAQLVIEEKQLFHAVDIVK